MIAGQCSLNNAPWNTNSMECCSKKWWRVLCHQIYFGNDGNKFKQDLYSKTSQIWPFSAITAYTTGVPQNTS